AASSAWAKRTARVARMTDPYGCRELRREADEPSVGEVIDGAGLAAGWAADVCEGAGTTDDVCLQDLDRLIGYAVSEDARAFGLRLGAVEGLVVVHLRNADLGDRGQLVAVPV